MPTLADDFGQGRRCLAIDHGLHVMGRRIRFLSIRAARVFRTMLRRIPAAASEVHATHESQPIVDDDDLLVMASTGRVDIVHFEMDARVFERVLSEDKLWIANVGEQD
jgi:hypothetical protein